MTEIKVSGPAGGIGGASRPPAVAGLFYPADRKELHTMLEGLLGQAPRRAGEPKALIVPHAGYIYSGPVAASAYASLSALRKRIRRVVLLGPAHRVYLRGLALPSVRNFDTPLGPVPLDVKAFRSLQQLPQVQVMDSPHAEEHSLEVQLPFLQTVLDEFHLVPLVVGDASPEEVAQVLEALWGGEDTLIVISTDLSHYHDYDTARRLDSETSLAIERMEFERIRPEQACGCVPLRGFLKVARERGLAVNRLDLRNSGDTAGSRLRVVGYGAYSVGADREVDRHRTTLLQLARESIRHGLLGRDPPAPEQFQVPEALRAAAALFVTLTLEGRLRGCIGTTEARSGIAAAVIEHAYNAAFHDPRFPALVEEEFTRIRIAVSLLDPPVPIPFRTEAELIATLQVGMDGLIIAAGERRATFLPAVWEGIAEPAEFLAQLKVKAGLAPGEMPSRAWRYRTRTYCD